ncbi:hypothetical protein UMM65_04815 [Aureibaculum sp. 2210JD6-5]|nr:hypothetical protein [Aureibaculum sp. 2210JD6-5]
MKYEYHNYLTGKLSDFAGLFAFPYFFSCFLPKKIKSIYILTGILFVFWKSEFSQPLFDVAHANGIGINRVVDYSDLFALFILPFSYQYWKSEFKSVKKMNRIFKPIIIAICCFAFIATSQPRMSHSYDLKSDFETTITSKIDSTTMKMYFYRPDKVGGYRYTVEVPDRRTWIETKVEITELPDGKFKVKLDSILNYTMTGNGSFFFSNYDKDDVEYVENLSKADIEKLFEKQLKEQLKEK